MNIHPLKLSLATVLLLAATTPALAVKPFNPWTVGAGVSRADMETKITGEVFDDQVLLAGRFLGSYSSSAWRFQVTYEQGESSSGVFFENFSQLDRDRFTFSARSRLTPYVEVGGGVQAENIEYTETFFGDFSSIQIDDGSVFGLVRLQTPPKRVGFYGEVRLRVGHADFDVPLGGLEEDSNGYALEVGLPITIGDSGRWTLTPGYEHDGYEAGDFEITSDKVFFNASFSFGG